MLSDYSGPRVGHQLIHSGSAELLSCSESLLGVKFSADQLGVSSVAHLDAFIELSSKAVER